MNTFEMSGLPTWQGPRSEFARTRVSGEREAEEAASARSLATWRQRFVRLGRPRHLPNS